MSDEPEKTACYNRIIAMYIDLARDTVLKVFFHLTPIQDVDKFFASTDVCKKLEHLKLQNILSEKEYELVTRPHLSPRNFDISLLITLLTNLYTSKLPAPMNGWEAPAAPEDLSIAADLLRLRQIRNTLVARQPRASLKKTEFEHLWKDVENILVRLIQHVDSTSEATLKENIVEYEKCHFDPTDERSKTYFQKLQEWHDKVSVQQEKVEELLKKTQELALFFRHKPHTFYRFVKLLLDGGKQVLCGLLQKELSKRKQSLQTLLRGKHAVLKEMIADEVLLKQLSITHDDAAILTTEDTDKWDILVLASVLICILDESAGEEVADIRTIMDARKNYADISLMTLDNDKYTSFYATFLSSLRGLSSGLDADLRKKCMTVIANCNTDSLEIQDGENYFELLRAHGCAIRSIIDVNTEMIKRLKERLREMVKEGIPFLKNHDLDIKLVMLGKNEKKRKASEEIVETVFQDVIGRSGNPSEYESIREEVGLILDKIREIPDVKLLNVQKGCILLFMRIYSWHGLLQILEYLDSSHFQRQLQNISSEVSVDQDLVLSGHLTLECLHAVLNHLHHALDETEYKLIVPIKCRTAEAIRKVLKVIRDEGTTSRFDELAKRLSSAVGAEIAVNVSADEKGFKGVFDESDKADKTEDKQKKEISQDTDDEMKKESKKIRGNSDYREKMKADESVKETLDKADKTENKRKKEISQDTDDEMKKERKKLRGNSDYWEETKADESIKETLGGVHSAVFPDQKVLNEMWAKAKENDTDKMNVIELCKDICNAIESKYWDKVLRAWPAYDSDKTDSVEFVIITKEHVDGTEISLEYSATVRPINTYSKEATQVMKSKENNEYQLSFIESENIRRAICNHANELMANHRELSAISGSGVRSKGFEQGNNELIQQACIVMYVNLKGKIPLDETKFPNSLDDIPVDVREGEFQNCASARVFQDKLHMGCQIKSGQIGTLGGFVDHPKYGLSAITCAHVVLDEQELHDIRKDTRMMWRRDEKPVYQPDKKDISRNRCGQVKEAILKSGEGDTSGVDLAIFAIDQRAPEDGTFSDGTDMVFETGKLCSSVYENYNHVMKFGRTTYKTEGFVQFSNAVVRLIEYTPTRKVDSKKYTYSLFNQFEIRPIQNQQNFAQKGDSGSLVFKRDISGDLLCIGMVVGVLEPCGNGVVIPISAIKSELGVSELKSFSWNMFRRMDSRLERIEKHLLGK